MSDLLKKIRSRGHWKVVIRPSKYAEHRIKDISDLLPLLQRLAVKLRSWDFPHIDYRARVHVDLDWIGQESDWEHHKTSWRFYQSGQFAHVGAMPLDWRDESTIWPVDDQWQPGRLLGVGDTLFSFLEILEFTSRLSLSKAGDDLMYLRIETVGLKGRSLYIDSHRSRWSFHNAYTASIDTYPIDTTLRREELVARTEGLAIGFALEIFKRFGWSATEDLLRDWIEKRG